MHVRASLSPGLAITLCLVASCAATDRTEVEGRVASARAALIGLTAAELPGCLVPTNEVYQTQTKVQYLYYEIRPGDRVLAPRQASRDGFPGREIFDSETGASAPGVSYCRLTFRLEDGVVTQVSEEARSGDGIRDLSCLVRKVSEACATPSPAKADAPVAAPPAGSSAPAP